MAITNPHTNFISQVKLPGSDTVYDIHDASAIHDISDLDLATIMKFKGSVESYDKLPTGAKAGDVYLVGTTEYFYTGSAWEELGEIHDAVSKAVYEAHKHEVGVSGTNSASAVTVEGDIPTVTPTSTWLKATATAPSVTLDVPTNSALTGITPSTKKITPSVSTPVAVDGNGTAKAYTSNTPSTGSFITGVSASKGDAITGIGAPTTSAAVKELNTTTIKNPSVSNVSIPQYTHADVTASKVTSEAGTAAAWSAQVNGGVLSFSWTANTPTTVTAENVTASKATAAAALSASAVALEDVTVATGIKITVDAITAMGEVSTGSFATGVSTEAGNALTGIEFSTTDTLTGVKVTTQPVVTLDNDTFVSGVTSSDAVFATGASVKSVSAPAITVAEDTSGDVQIVKNVAVGTKTGSMSGTAAAQTWTGTVTVSTPVEG
jgi:hypothetical protein